MARITVEDCIDKFPSRFELVLVASQRARKLHSGEAPTVDKDNDKSTVIALREIADSTISVHEMKENLIQEYQTITINDEEEENLELETTTDDQIINNQSSNKNEDQLFDETSKEIETETETETEIENLIVSEESELSDQYEITDTSETENNEDINKTEKEIENLV